LSGVTSNSILRSLARRVLPVGVRSRIWHTVNLVGQWESLWRLVRLRRRVFSEPSAYGRHERFLGFTLRITDGLNYYMQYKDEFVHRIYHFEACRPDPLIIDGGSNVGMSIFYFKHTYPQSRIIGFEPDPGIFGILQHNVSHNRLKDVRLINAGLSAQAGSVTFTPDGTTGGRIGEGQNGIEVRMELLSDYLDDPVDFCKLNIEGEELSVLREAVAEGKLRNIREIVLEYHGWASGEQRLGDILNLLDGQGYRYLVHDFDAETCSASKPPFRIRPETTWFCLVYARRLDDCFHKV
jgi:FkbM family methyltransferase